MKYADNVHTEQHNEVISMNAPNTIVTLNLFQGLHIREGDHYATIEFLVFINGAVITLTMSES